MIWKKGNTYVYKKRCHLLTQVTVAGYTAGQRAKHVPRGKLVAGASILTGTSVTMVMLVVLRVFPLTPRYIIPVAGMMVGNSMTVTGVTMKRLRDDIRTQFSLVFSLSLSYLYLTLLNFFLFSIIILCVIRFWAYWTFNHNLLFIFATHLIQVETALALGATPRQATHQQVKRALVVALSPVVDNAKTVGLISLPGAMTGLIMGGASPIAAIQLQIVVMNFLIGASTVSSIMSTYLCWPSFFTAAYQLETAVFTAAWFHFPFSSQLLTVQGIYIISTIFMIPILFKMWSFFPWSLNVTSISLLFVLFFHRLWFYILFRG